MSGPSKSQARKAGKRLTKWWLREVELTDSELDVHIAVVQGWRLQHASPLALTTPGLRNWVGRETDVRPIPVAQRMKQLTTIVEKLGRHPGMNIDRMQDIAGCRGILPSAEAIDRVAARIHRYWDVVGDDDYRVDGKPATGYRARHIIVMKRDRRVEVQLRTTEQHRWAEIVAGTGERLGYGLKDGRGPAELLEYFRVASDMLWLQEQGRRMSPTQRVRFSELREAVRPHFAPRD